MATYRRVTAVGHRCSYRYALAEHAPQAPTTPSSNYARADMLSGDPSTVTDPGITEAVFSVMRNAGRPLTQPEITERVQRINPRYDGDYVGVILYRQRRRNGRAIVRRGETGRFVYLLRSQDDGSVPEAPAKVPRFGGLNLRERLFAELAENPSDDYHALARKLLDADDRATVRRLRDRIHWYHRSGQLRRRSDGAWEVPLLH